MIKCREKSNISLTNDVDFDSLFNEDKKIENNYRLMYSAQAYLEMGEFLKGVWKKRGINLK